VIIYVGEAPLLFQLVSHTVENSDSMVVVKCLICGTKMYYPQTKTHAITEHQRTKVRIIPREGVPRVRT